MPRSDRSALLRALRQPQTYGRAPRSGDVVEVRETHAAWVFLVGQRAFKVKKAVVLPFLDFGILERRHRACRAEVELNQVLAPDIYLGVRPIVRRGQGFALGPLEAAPADAVEYGVEMRRFDEADTWAARLASGRLTRAAIIGLARRLGQFHEHAARVSMEQPDHVARVWSRNLEELPGSARQLGAPRLRAAAVSGVAFVRSHAPEIAERVSAGHVREGHGDLRCEHVVSRDGEVQVVDRLEFDPGLRTSDVASDLAFLVMDLHARGAPGVATELVEQYRAAGGSPGSDALLDFYSAHRALVRSKVAFIAAEQRSGPDRENALMEALELFALAERFGWHARKPHLLAICGAAGTGKSTLANALSEASGLEVLSSDRVRKELAGVNATDRAPDRYYSDTFSRATYEELGRRARQRLGARGGAILDATCRRRVDREALRQGLKGGESIRFVRCHAPGAVAAARALQRMTRFDRVSDAGPEMARVQAEAFEPLDDVQPGDQMVLHTAPPPPVLLAQVATWLDERALAHSPGDASGRASSGAAARPRSRVIEATHSLCAHCGEPIGVYEPAIHLAPDGMARETSRAAEPHLISAPGLLFHTGCHQY